MDTLEFIASLVKSVAWPIVVMVGLFLFSGPIAKRIHAIRNLSYKDAKISFEEVAKEVRASLTVEAVEKDQRALIKVGEKQNYSNVNRIIVLWSGLISGIRRMVITAGHDATVMSDQELIQFAADEQILTPEQFKAVNGLRTMRNLAVHSPAKEISEQQYQQFYTLTDAMATVLGINPGLR